MPRPDAPAVVVIGSGVAGASTAFALAHAGAQVTVVDAEWTGQATAAGAGIIQPWSSTVDGPMYDLYAAGATHYPHLVKQLAESGVADLGYRVSGSLVVNADEAVLAEVEQRVLRRTAGVAVAGTVERLDEATARSMFPPLAPGLEALHISGGARVDGRRLRIGLLDAARRLGARVESAQARIKIKNGRLTVHAGDHPIGADAVVVAAGAWTNRLLAALDYRLPVEPQRGQIAHLELADTDTSGWPSVLPMASHYIVCFDDGRIVAGATRETGSGFDSRVTAEGVREVLTNALGIAPGLSDATLLEMRVGLRPLASDQLPFLGAVPDLPELYLNAGFGAAGLTMAPLAGAALAQLILEGSSDFDLKAFAPPERPAVR